MSEHRSAQWLNAVVHDDRLDASDLSYLVSLYPYLVVQATFDHRPKLLPPAGG